MYDASPVLTLPYRHVYTPPHCSCFFVCYCLCLLANYFLIALGAWAVGGFSSGEGFEE